MGVLNKLMSKDYMYPTDRLTSTSDRNKDILDISAIH